MRLLIELCRMRKQTWISAMVLLAIFAVHPACAKADNSELFFETLDEVTESVDVFRSIRTGDIWAKKIGEKWYYRFTEKNYPTVYINVSAFGSRPQNYYLVDDNASLTQNCKSSHSRVCYYKTYSVTSTDLGQKHRISMYRLELHANANTSDELLFEARVSSGVTFTWRYDYEAKSEFDYRKMLYRSSAVTGPDKLQPIISVAVLNKGNDNVCISYAEVTGGYGDCLGDKSGSGYLKIASDAIACRDAVKAALDKPSKFTAATALITCTSAVIEAKTVGEQTTYISRGEKSIDGGSYNAKIESPVLLRRSDNFVRGKFKLNQSFDKSKTDFWIAFEFV